MNIHTYASLESSSSKKNQSGHLEFHMLIMHILLSIHFAFIPTYPCTSFVRRLCSLDQWNNRSIPPGSIVLCFSTTGQLPSSVAAESILSLNGSGLIFAEPSTMLVPADDLLPTVHVDLNQGTQILYYIRSSKYALPRNALNFL